MTKRKDRRSFSTEFKKEILNLADRGEVTIAELAKKHDLTINMICRWRRELRDQVIDETVASAPRIEKLGVDPKYVRQLEDQLRTANEKLGELYIVVDGLKKSKIKRLRKVRVRSSLPEDPGINEKSLRNNWHLHEHILLQAKGADAFGKIY